MLIYAQILNVTEMSDAHSGNSNYLTLINLHPSNNVHFTRGVKFYNILVDCNIK